MALLDHWCATTKKNFKAIELNAYKENKAGHRFYDREGFVHLGFHFVKRL